MAGGCVSPTFAHFVDFSSALGRLLPSVSGYAQRRSSIDVTPVASTSSSPSSASPPPPSSASFLSFDIIHRVNFHFDTWSASVPTPRAAAGPNASTEPTFSIVLGG